MLEWFDLFLAVSIFSGMGTGKDSGKLLFRKLYSTGGFSIEDGESSMTFSSSGGSGTPINSCEIVFGTGTGITSSVDFKVCTSKRSIFGKFNSIRPYHNLENASSVQNSDYAFVIAGCQNKIASSKYSVIIGGSTNSVSKSSCQSIILGGKENKISCIKNSAILSGCKNKIFGYHDENKDTSSHSSIIGGYKNEICHSGLSSIIGGVSNYMLSRDNNCNYSNLIAGSKGIKLCNCVKFSEYATIGKIHNSVVLSSGSSQIQLGPTNSSYSGVNAFSEPKISFSNIISSCESLIHNTSKTYENPKFNNIISSVSSCTSGLFSSIISSKNSCIYTYVDQILKPYKYNSYTQIISSENSCIMGRYSQIIGSRDSFILAGCSDSVSKQFNQILGGCKNSIKKNNTYSTILGGYENKMEYYPGVINYNSIMINGEYNCMINSGQFFSGCKNCNCYTGSISGCSFYGDSIIIGGFYQKAINSISINSFNKKPENLGGMRNSILVSAVYSTSGYQFRESKYGGYSGSPNVLNGNWRGSFLRSPHSSVILSSLCVNTTSDKLSIVMASKDSIMSNTCNSMIIGGKENCMRSVGDFGTSSEDWFFSNYLSGAVCDTVCNNFIIGGEKNKFLSNIPNNYAFFGYGFTTSKVFNTCNSGIIGGYQNCIVNECDVFNSLSVEDLSLKNAIISGGKNIKLSTSNTFASNTIIVGGGSIQTKYNNTIYTGVSGTFTITGTSQIRFVNGLVVSVT
jgi:hypothetical protein